MHYLFYFLCETSNRPQHSDKLLTFLLVLSTNICIIPLNNVFKAVAIKIKWH